MMKAHLCLPLWTAGKVSSFVLSGEMFTRPGILVDAFPSPYPNEEDSV